LSINRLWEEQIWGLLNVTANDSVWSEYWIVTWNILIEHSSPLTNVMVQQRPTDTSVGRHFENSQQLSTEVFTHLLLATNFMFRWPCILINFVMKTNWMHYRVRINYRTILQNLMTDASSGTKLFIPHWDRRLRRTTTSKLPSQRALNRHKFQDTPTTLSRWGSHFPPTLVYAFPARWQ
jgi:hypothetical protein